MTIRPNKLPLLLLAALKLNATVWLLTVSRNSQFRSLDARRQQFQQLWFLQKLLFFFLWPRHPPSSPRFLIVQVICSWSLQNAWKHFYRCHHVCRKNRSPGSPKEDNLVKAVLQREYNTYLVICFCLQLAFMLLVSSQSVTAADIHLCQQSVHVKKMTWLYDLFIYVALIIVSFAAAFLLVGHCSHCRP